MASFTQVPARNKQGFLSGCVQKMDHLILLQASAIGSRVGPIPKSKSKARKDKVIRVLSEDGINAKKIK